MNATKPSIMFIVLSVVLLIAISLLPESLPVPAASAPIITTVPTPAVAIETRSSFLAPLAEAPFGWTVIVMEY